MKLASPLRYPGGKSSFTPLLREVRRLNGLGSTKIAEPFGGGAGASLSMVFLEDTDRISINDADPLIHDFWWALLHQSKRFLKLLDETEVSISEWTNQRKINSRPSGQSRLRRGFSTFYLNRCNRSGIILKGGPIGGYNQEGKWKIDARYNRENLRERCERIIEYRDRITISGMDGIDFIAQEASESTFLFIDPPYYRKGPRLYLNSLDADYHERLAETLKEREHLPWVVTYDDCNEIRDLYGSWANVRSFGLRYSASGASVGREVWITPKWMQVPAEAESHEIHWENRSDPS